MHRTDILLSCFLCALAQYVPQSLWGQNFVEPTKTYQNKSEINPAYVGFVPGIRLGTKSVTATENFKTEGFEITAGFNPGKVIYSSDSSFNVGLRPDFSWGIGFYYFQSEVQEIMTTNGGGTLNPNRLQNIALSTAFHIDNPEKKSNFSMGVKLAYARANAGLEPLIFTEQIDPLAGAIFEAPDLGNEQANLARNQALSLSSGMIFSKNTTNHIWRLNAQVSNIILDLPEDWAPGNPDNPNNFTDFPKFALRAYRQVNPFKKIMVSDSITHLPREFLFEENVEFDLVPDVRFEAQFCPGKGPNPVYMSNSFGLIGNFHPQNNRLQFLVGIYLLHRRVNLSDDPSTSVLPSLNLTVNIFDPFNGDLEWLRGGLPIPKTEIPALSAYVNMVVPTELSRTNGLLTNMPLEIGLRYTIPPGKKNKSWPKRTNFDMF
ncbi:MAG: hypothetical protein MRZ79_09970 [Bacteroidia bacterium]|nr:hypothetical protein [Bacteroidia bacterium]